MSTQAHIHVIKKANIGEHKTVPITTTLPALHDGHVRFRSVVVSLTSNNLTYAQMGSMLKWWDMYPVQSELPSPFNDQDTYGIVPVWGYGEVLESKVAGLEPRMLVWGFWPTTDLAVDLKLDPAGVEGHWIETSDFRKDVQTMYKRFILRDVGARLASLDQSKYEQMAWESACRPIWEAGYLLSHAIFGEAHAHPANAGPWTEADADLTSAVVISLSASGKTPRAFTEALVHRGPSEGPLGFLAITSTVKSSLCPKAAFPTKIVEYANMADNETMEWIQAQRPKKIVIADFGGRGDSLFRLHEALVQHLSGIEIMVMGVGGNPDMRTADDLGQWAQRNNGSKSFDRIQMNTTEVRDVMMERDGAGKYFEGLDAAWDRYRQSSVVSDMKLQLGKGIDGDEGFEGGWTRICDGWLPSDVAQAYTV
ncbi:hypothetical protein LTR09_001366 [Extremus antarcticus]|uniref:Uncharacterized protein n=1 Tax=Extremus antarcticus TaxID=702011 RepID=A0AAJ0GIM0_9PEZI|nr:hypothetical protein LTR09_001366 [Extremus antarcticus]